MTDDKQIEALKARFGASDQGNYFVSGTIGVPHPYCIGAKHVAWAADHFSGRLGAEAIRDAEKRGGARCCIPKCPLSFDDHEQALLVSCKGPLKDEDGNAVPELHSYLLRCKLLAEERYAGFAFLDEAKP